MKTVRFITLLLALAISGWAAIPAGAVWELRASATAGNVNGCFYAGGGTDYSLQDAAQLTNTDGAGTGTTNFSSAGSTFTSAMVGNGLHITVGGGLTVGWYHIAAFVDANNVTLDRSPGTGSAATFYVGGACSMNSTLDDDLTEAVVAGNIIWMKSGSYSTGESVNSSVAGTAASPIILEGYNSTRGDDPTGTNRPLLTLAANSFQTSNYWKVRHIRFTGTAASMVTMGTGCLYENTSLVNTSSTASRTALVGAQGGLVLNSVVQSYRGIAIGAGNSSTFSVVNSWIRDSATGVSMTSNQPMNIIGNIFSSHTSTALVTTGITSAYRAIITGNTFYGSENTTGTGISGAAGPIPIVMNNIFYGFATGITVSGANDGYTAAYNTFYNNGTDRTTWPVGDSDIALNPGFVGVGQVTGTAGAFTAGNDRLVDTSKNFTTAGVVAGRDFLFIVSGTGAAAGIYGISSVTTTTNPNDTLVLDLAPGTNVTADKVYQITTGQNFAVGTNMKAVGHPGAFQGGYSTGYMDIGAVQRQESAGGAGTTSYGGVQ